VSYAVTLAHNVLINLQFTKPFVSTRIARDLEIEEDVHLHTPVDDLESFLWVLLYTILEIGHCYGKLIQREVAWLRMMTNEDEGHLSSRTTAMQSAVITTGTFRASDHALIFRKILRKWAAIAKSNEDRLEYALPLKPAANELVQSSRSTYAEYLKSGFEELSTLPTSWSEWCSTQKSA
jgi:hypothetical protein